MAEGNLRLPKQFNGLVRREPFDFEDPFEICEVEPIVNKEAFEPPPESSWLLAAESWRGLKMRASVWHYINRDNPIAHGSISLAFQGVILSGVGPLLWYKPVSEHVPFTKHCVFRRVPTPLYLSFATFRVPEGVKVNAYTFAGNDVCESTYDIGKRLTWHQLKIDIRVALTVGGVISAARSFHLRDSEGNEKSGQSFVFKPCVGPFTPDRPTTQGWHSPCSEDSLFAASEEAPEAEKNHAMAKAEKKPAMTQAKMKRMDEAVQKKPASMKRPSAKREFQVVQKKPASMKRPSAKREFQVVQKKPASMKKPAGKK